MSGLEIRYCERVGGLALFTCKGYKEAGETVLDLAGDGASVFLSMPTRHSVELGPGLHAIHPFGSFLNHSFQPSVRVDKPSGKVVTVAPIPAGGELHFDYNATETRMACPFTTREGRPVCGSSVC